MGTVKTKECATTSMLWPKVYNDMENNLSTCQPCMMYKVKQQAEPLEHNVPTKPWCSLMLDNFEYKELDTFCKDLGIVLNFSSGYHHSANQAECTIRTVKSLIKRCDSAGVHWRIALLEFICTPGPDGVSPSSLMGRQFCGILLMIEKVTNSDVYSDKFSDRKLKDKVKFDNKHSRTLKPFTLNTTISHLNADLKTWSVGSVVSRSPDNRSHHIKTENGQIISHNRVHLGETMLNLFLRCKIFQKFNFWWKRK